MTKTIVIKSINKFLVFTFYFYNNYTYYMYMGTDASPINKRISCTIYKLLYSETLTITE